MAVSLQGPIEDLTMALCGRPAREHWRQTPDGFERASCQECAAVGRVLSAARRGGIARDAAAAPASQPVASSPVAGQPIRQVQGGRR